MKYLDTEDYGDALFQLGGVNDHSKEPPWKAVGKDYHLKKGRMGKK